MLRAENLRWPLENEYDKKYQTSGMDEVGSIWAKAVEM